MAEKDFIFCVKRNNRLLHHVYLLAKPVTG